jgi:hypothetical protein
MKRSIFGLLVICCFLSVAVSASALSIGPTDVGGPDYLLNSAILGKSGEKFEIAWIEENLGEGFVLDYQKTDFDEGGGATNYWEETDEKGTWGMELVNSPSYFLIKTGKINQPDYRWFLFQNLAELDWAVVDLTVMGEEFDPNVDFNKVAFNGEFNIDKFSHIGEVNPVPEPSTMLLLGSGLVGLVYWRRRNKG